eukprot:CAMPEP_0178434084 /NCGR_PEP_ID=MMETSP0689_2-20121128/33241_1 /TAXON_ID=160604 /ORGANISM="Amphidinium massartii, Strain CS-259" /LENGTH=224 /DNA_ID=CAMNT_0020056137 /DNA_START=34 /DNA_END=708 /DNA_ORIENTATION=-
MLLLVARHRAAASRIAGAASGVGTRGVSTSAIRHGGFPPFLHMPPPPPPEFEPDGSPRKYPLHQPIWDHGYKWEHWTLIPAGVFHTVYYGDFAQDYPPYWAWLQSIPVWVCAPLLTLWALTTMVIFQNAGSIGIRPKRYTIEWLIATKERERLENTNPVTRYLDRRRAERGSTWIAQYHLPWHPFWMWMRNTHDTDFPEYYRPVPPRPGLHYQDDMTKTFVNED